MGMETFWKLLLELSSIIFVKFDRRKYLNKACSPKNKNNEKQMYYTRSTTIWNDLCSRNELMK